MTAEEFRRLALSLPETLESSHLGHPDFRVGGRIFASLGYPDEDSAALKLTSDQQTALVGALPAVFRPAPGKWGCRGYTLISLPPAAREAVLDALLLAWRNTAPKRLRRLAPEPP